MKCRFPENDKVEKVAEFVRVNGDGLPEVAIQNSVSDENLDNWVLECDENNNIISGVTYEQSDWYLCTLHYLATDEKHRGKGLGSKVVGEVMEKTKANPGCMVLTADITYNNDASKNIFIKHGFKEKTRFCWGKGKDKEPADILHYVRFPPECKDGECTTC